MCQVPVAQLEKKSQAEGACELTHENKSGGGNLSGVVGAGRNSPERVGQTA